MSRKRGGKAWVVEGAWGREDKANAQDSTGMAAFSSFVIKLSKETEARAAQPFSADGSGAPLYSVSTYSSA